MSKLKFKKEKKLKINTTDRGFDSYDFKLGDLLRGERATLGLSLMDVQRALKINVEIISAIERCEISNDQDSVFIPGYVKSYAKFLNLDPDWVLERFCEETDYKNPSPIRKTKSKTQQKHGATANIWKLWRNTFCVSATTLGCGV